MRGIFSPLGSVGEGSVEWPMLSASDSPRAQSRVGSLCTSAADQGARSTAVGLSRQLSRASQRRASEKEQISTQISLRLSEAQHLKVSIEAALPHLERLLESVYAATPLVSVCAAGASSLALLGSGELLSWGEQRLLAGSGKGFGEGERFARFPSPRLALLQGVRLVQLSASSPHALAVSAEGELFAWGRADRGALGRYSNAHATKCLLPDERGRRYEPTPRPVRALRGVSIRRVAAGSAHSLAASEDGRLFAWGERSLGRLGLGGGSQDEQGAGDHSQEAQDGICWTPKLLKTLSGISEASLRRVSHLSHVMFYPFVSYHNFPFVTSHVCPFVTCHVFPIRHTPRLPICHAPFFL